MYSVYLSCSDYVLLFCTGDAVTIVYSSCAHRV